MAICTPTSATQQLSSISLSKNGLWEHTDDPKRKVSLWLQKQRRFRVINIPPKNGAAPPTPSTSTNNVDVTPTVSNNVPVLDDDSLSVSSPLDTSSFGKTRRRRSIQSNREKRKRYRANRRLRKTYTDSATGQSVTFESEQENSVSRSDTCSESTSFHPGSDRWDTLMDQAELSRILQENKRIELENQYGNFVDESPSFPVDERKVILPDSLRGLDRVEVGAQISDILKKENKALSQARFFRNCCAHLKMRIRELENEKEGIRFFWRNQIVEGQSRAGKILKLAVDSNKHSAQ